MPAYQVSKINYQVINQQVKSITLLRLITYRKPTIHGSVKKQSKYSNTNKQQQQQQQQQATARRGRRNHPKLKHTAKMTVADGKGDKTKTL